MQPAAEQRRSRGGLPEPSHLPGPRSVNERGDVNGLTSSVAGSAVGQRSETGAAEPGRQIFPDDVISCPSTAVRVPCGVQWACISNRPGRFKRPPARMRWHSQVSNSEMRIFFAEQGRTRVSGRRTAVRRSRKPAEDAAQRKKDHFWMDTNWGVAGHTRRQESRQRPGKVRKGCSRRSERT